MMITLRTNKLIASPPPPLFGGKEGCLTLSNSEKQDREIIQEARGVRRPLQEVMDRDQAPKIGTPPLLEGYFLGHYYYYGSCKSIALYALCFIIGPCVSRTLGWQINLASPSHCTICRVRGKKFEGGCGCSYGKHTKTMGEYLKAKTFCLVRHLSTEGPNTKSTAAWNGADWYSSWVDDTFSLLWMVFVS